MFHFTVTCEKLYFSLHTCTWKENLTGREKNSLYTCTCMCTVNQYKKLIDWLNVV